MVCACIALLAGCASREAPPPFPAYTGAIAELFDNSLSRRFLLAEAGDRLFHARLVEADTVLEARIRTVNADTRDGIPAYQLSLNPTRALLGALPESPLVLSVPREHPSYAMIRLGHRHLVGRRAILIIKNFTNDDGTITHHVRVEPDDATTRGALAIVKL